MKVVIRVPKVEGLLMDSIVNSVKPKSKIVIVNCEESNAKPRVRTTKKNTKPSEITTMKRSPKANNKGKGKKRPSLLSKSIYRYHYQRTKPKLRRLMEANELLKEELERKNKEMTVLCSDIHNLLERLEPYVCGSLLSNPETETVSNPSKKRNPVKKPSKTKAAVKTPKRKCPQEKSVVGKPIAEKPVKRPKKAPIDKPSTLKLNPDYEEEKLRIVEEVELLLNGNAVEKDKVPKKEPHSYLNDLHFVTLHNQQILDDFMMLEFNLKRNEFDSMNEHDSCNGSMSLISMPKESLDDSSSLVERRGSLELSSEASSADSLSTQTDPSFLKQMKSHLSFFIPSEMDHELLNPDIPQTLPDDIFSET